MFTPTELKKNVYPTVQLLEGLRPKALLLKTCHIKSSMCVTFKFLLFSSLQLLKYLIVMIKSFYKTHTIYDVEM